MPVRKKIIRPGDEYDPDELERGGEEAVLEEVQASPEPPVEVQGEPWGWTKEGPTPRGFPGPDHSRDDPGPHDGSWDKPGGQR